MAKGLTKTHLKWKGSVREDAKMTTMDDHVSPLVRDS
jgi:hypothetical protein